MITFLSILITILILLLAITIHELGHFLAGRFFKAKILEFSIGFGPKLASKVNRKFTTISFRGIPLGGYVKFGHKKLLGLQQQLINDAIEKNKIDQAEKLQNEYWFIHFDKIQGKTFETLKPFEKIIIFLAGPIFNLITTILLMIIIEQLMFANVKYFSNLDNSIIFTRAHNAGIQILYSFMDTFRASIYILEAIGKAVGQMFQGNSPEIHSIVGMSKDVSSVLHVDNIFTLCLTLTMSISASLFTFNLLIPIPPLDGWWIMNELIKKIIKRDIPEKIENIITITGISIIMLFTLSIIIYDLI